MRVCIVGTGYVGLVTGACLSDSGNHVTCLDVDAKKVAQLQSGKVPIFEPGLDELVVRNLKAKRLSFTTSAKDAIPNARAVFVAVGTPPGNDGSVDLKYVVSAVETIRDHASPDTLVVMKSTVPVGTADRARAILASGRHRTEVVSNPEFLKEGTAVNDFMRPERVIIGAESADAKRVMDDLYAPYLRSGNPVYFMSNRSAELAKYAANAFLAMKISFINDLALLCEKTEADIHDVRRALVSDSRIGNKFMYPGCGYGGSCFPKDVQALVHLGEQVNHPLTICSAVHDVNEKQKKVLFSKIQRHFRSLPGKTIALWGLSFKPMTDDMREAPSVSLIESLLNAGCKVKAYDPVARTEAEKLFHGRITLAEDAYEAAQGADGLAILTEWNEFRSPDFDLLKKKLTTPVIFDGRNLYSRESLKYEGFTYYCIGTPDPK